MQEHGQTIVFLMTVAIFAAVLVLVLKRKITERFAILWVSISILLLIASSIGFRHLFKLAQLIGIVYPPSALFLLVIFGLTLLMIQLFTWISKLNERTRALSQEIALLQDRLETGREPAAPGRGAATDIAQQKEGPGRGSTASNAEPDLAWRHDD